VPAALFPFPRFVFALLSIIVAIVPACGPSASHGSQNFPAAGRLITMDQIERSGGRTAWDVLKREAPMFLFSEDRNGRPSRLGRRGRASIILDDSPLLFVDGIRWVDFKGLADLPASSLFSIWLLSGAEGTTYYGTDATAGVIVIRTRDGHES
jgi:vitamin B12 transporter